MTVKTEFEDIVEQDTWKTLTWDIITTHFNFWPCKARRGPRAEVPGRKGHRRAWDPPPPLRRAGHGGAGAEGAPGAPQAPWLSPPPAPRPAPERRSRGVASTSAAPTPPGRGSAARVSREVRYHGAPCSGRRREISRDVPAERGLSSCCPVKLRSVLFSSGDERLGVGPAQG